jgi:hypothetical protein
MELAELEGREMPDPNLASSSLFNVVVEITDENETSRRIAARSACLK